jgi:hypothetical protein
MGATGNDVWKLGEDIYTPNTVGDALRYMYDPALGGDYDWYPTRYIGYDDNGGVHSNSGIANLAFYLLVMGGQHPRYKSPDVNVTGIGYDDAAKIFYHANADCLTAAASFEEARYCTANALGGNYSINVHAAWDAVGVPPYQPPPPPAIYAYKLLIHTDNYPRETTWTITDDCGNNPMGGGPYGLAGADSSYYLVEEGKYTLTVNDKYGDGFCCSEGSGAFSVSRQNGTMIARGGNFGYTDSASFGHNSCHSAIPSSLPSAAPSTSSAPSAMPSTMPSYLPSSEPSTSAAPSTSSPPSDAPSSNPSENPSSKPSDQPSDQPSTTPIWIEIFANDFERGLGNFNDGSRDVRLYSGKKFAHKGKKSLELRDNNPTMSLSSTDPFTVSSYSTLKVEFWYKSRGFKKTHESFSLESYGDNGTDWTEKGTWTYLSNNGFTSNNRWRFVSVEFPIDTITTMRIRFKNNGDKRKTKVYIDDVTVSGTVSG